MLRAARLTFAPGEQMLAVPGLRVAFAIKVPMFPLHTWLPDAHVEAPTAGSVILAGVHAEDGHVRLLRFACRCSPRARAVRPWIAALAVVGIIYGALVAMVQTDMKKLVAYSSVSHLGFVVLGIFSFTQLGIDGAVYQMLNHGISTGALFLLVGMLYERRHRSRSPTTAGWRPRRPALHRLPDHHARQHRTARLNSFVGEFLVLQGAATANFNWPSTPPSA